MSLHHLAKDMQSKGRNGDSVLVHMSPGEVHGLQALAMAHGGSLTINPETGLPEASFLSSLLPTILGAGLAMTGIGAPMAALMVGGGYGLAKGSLKEGLMAGLGAYGGAGLTSGLAASAPGAVVPGSATGIGAAAPGAALTPATSIGAATSGAAAPGATSMFSPLSGAPTSGMLAGGNANAMANAYGLAANPAGVAPMSGQLANMGANANTMAGQYGQLAQAVPAHTPLTSAVNVPSAFDQTIAGAKATYGGGMEGLKALYGNLPTGTMPALGLTLAQAMQQNNKLNAPAVDKGLIRPYTLDRQQNPQAYAQDTQGRTNTPVYGQPFDSSERMFFNDTFTAGTPYKAPGPEYAAGGGLMSLNSFDAGGAVENMSDMNAVGANTNYPMANIQSHAYANPMSQYPANTNVLAPSADAGVDTYTGSPTFAKGGMSGGIGHLGGYSDGGRLLRGPGDGVSDDIPASIGGRQPARLADGEFVVPARIVSELGNGSTEAGARRLYAMMDRVQNSRKKSIGKGKVAVNSKADKHLPA